VTTHPWLSWNSLSAPQKLHQPTQRKLSKH
jgi:hypothetical protein